MKTKVYSTFEKIEKKSRVENLLGYVSTICSAAESLGIFDSVVGDLEFQIHEVVEDNFTNKPTDESAD